MFLICIIISYWTWLGHAAFCVAEVDHENSGPIPTWRGGSALPSVGRFASSGGLQGTFEGRGNDEEDERLTLGDPSVAPPQRLPLGEPSVAPPRSGHDPSGDSTARLKAVSPHNTLSLLTID